MLPFDPVIPYAGMYAEDTNSNNTNAPYQLLHYSVICNLQRTEATKMSTCRRLVK